MSSVEEELDVVDKKFSFLSINKETIMTEGKDKRDLVMQTIRLIQPFDDNINYLATHFSSPVIIRFKNG